MAATYSETFRNNRSNSSVTRLAAFSCEWTRHCSISSRWPLAKVGVAKWRETATDSACTSLFPLTLSPWQLNTTVYMVYSLPEILAESLLAWSIVDRPALNELSSCNAFPSDLGHVSIPWMSS